MRASVRFGVGTLWCERVRSPAQNLRIASVAYSICCQYDAVPRPITVAGSVVMSRISLHLLITCFIVNRNAMLLILLVSIGLLHSFHRSHGLRIGYMSLSPASNVSTPLSYSVIQLSIDGCIDSGLIVYMHAIHALVKVGNTSVVCGIKPVSVITVDVEYSLVSFYGT